MLPLIPVDQLTIGGPALYLQDKKIASLYISFSLFGNFLIHVSDYRRHNVPQCPRAFDPDDYIFCCTKTTTDVFNLKVTTYGCCSGAALA